MLIFILIYSIITYNQVLSIQFSVPESVPVGHVVGYVEGSPKIATDARYFVVYSDDITEKIIKVDDRSGEIVTLQPLDYEKKTNFEVLAIPVQGGDGIQISIEVEDENDHVPTFADERITIEISEFARIGSEFPLPLADDRDGPSYNVQKYRIAQGNVNNVFKISSRRLNGVLYADLVVNGQLDREYRDKYELVIEALDGGKPPRIGKMRLNIKILDANDNAPVFEKPRYSASVSSTVSIGSTILTVKATDADIEENARITYRLQKTRSSSSSFFSMAPNGVLSTTAQLLPGAVHDLVVVASDHGRPSLEATAFATITVQGSTHDAPALDIIWLTDTTTAHLMENITLGSIVARLSVHENKKHSNLSLTGCPSLCMQQSESSRIYLLIVCGLFDRETTPEYHLKFIMKDSSDDILLEHPVLLTIGDVNDNAPQWSQLNMHLVLKRNGENVHVVDAFDPDQGANGRIHYSILDTDLIKIDADSGRLIIERELDCSVGSMINFRVRAEDAGKPSKYSDMTVIADLIDPSGKPPQFEKSLYEILVTEDTEQGSCLLKVRAYLVFVI
ncbi:unnamed protein product [Auanema sp. JU1783]|nr:unnamed protein product [Auanema sp. JU1783]